VRVLHNTSMVFHALLHSIDWTFGFHNFAHLYYCSNNYISTFNIQSHNRTLLDDPSLLLATIVFFNYFLVASIIKTGQIK